MKKLWAGRFTSETNQQVNDFHSSIRFDQRMYRQDIAGSIAHAIMLGEQGIISIEDAAAIVAGLHALLEDLQNGKVSFSPDAEDVHMNVESLLTQRIGTPGQRLHTGRSRNDQVALDLRMYTREACDELIAQLKTFITVLCDLAEQHLEHAMPGYTHLQRAQPITLGHHLMAYAQMMLRDITRFEHARQSADVMPLGSGALAGTTYPLNRARVAELLNFSAYTQNSLDGVSDRDFACDFVYACSQCMVHLSRLCEEVVLWSSQEFGFLQLDDAYATGSSIMPQKKNPDVAELTRGKTGRVISDLMTLLTMLKGLPLAYNKDMQEDKEALFDAHDTLVAVLGVFPPMLQTAVFNTQRMQRAALDGFANATDLADYLVKKGLPFRTAHEVSGKLVRYCLDNHCNLLDLTLEQLQSFDPNIGPDVFEAISLEACIRGRNLPGGPAPESVQQQIDAMRAAIRAE